MKPVKIAKVRSGSKKVQDCWSRLNASWAARNSFAGRMRNFTYLQETLHTYKSFHC